jgi:integrase/recombinase XerD
MIALGWAPWAMRKPAKECLRSWLSRIRLNHDLRHSFAVHTLVRWYRAGEDVGALLPRLSTYMGHFEPRYTYWYLSAAPELLRLAADRLEGVRR